MKMNRVFLILGLVLVGCGPSEVKRKQAFMQRCDAGFKPAQCEIYYELEKNSREAKDSADFAAFMSIINSGSNK